MPQTKFKATCECLESLTAVLESAQGLGGVMLTPIQRRALEIIRSAEFPGIRPGWFAKMMWPDAEGWKRSTKGRNSSIPGGGMVYAAAGYLGRLKRAGLVEWYWDTRRDDWGYMVSSEGERLLKC